LKRQQNLLGRNQKKVLMDVARRALASLLPYPQHSTLVDFSDSELIYSITWGARRPGLILGTQMVSFGCLKLPKPDNG
jgi:hypothetical protein